MDISEHNIIITGGASGFGKHLAETFSKKAKNVIVIDKNKEGFSQFNSFLNVKCYQCDLGDSTTAQTTINQIVVDFPDTRVLINNAGVIHNELLINFFQKEDRKHSIKNWDEMLNVNLSSVFYCSVNFADYLVEKRLKGLIINVSSISAGGNAGQSVYSAAKAGVNALTTAWSRELSMFGIRCAGIAPGFFDTPSTHSALKENAIKKIVKEIPNRKLGKLEELIHAVEFIIENDYYNGKILELDGGMTLSHG